MFIISLLLLLSVAGVSTIHKLCMSWFKPSVTEICDKTSALHDSSECANGMMMRQKQMNLLKVEFQI